MIDELGFHAVFVGIGAGYPTMLGIPGDSLNGVLSANELLTRCNLMRAKEFPNYDTPLPLGQRVAVVGAGNTAMDAMRVCMRLGADKVYCIYRRSRTEAPARAEEVHHAEEEGIEFHWLTNPVEVLDDGKGGVRGMRCVRMELGEPDDSGRRRPVPVAGSELDFETDLVVFAIGTNANPIMGQTSTLKLNKWGYIATDDDLATSVRRRLRRRRHRHRRGDRDRGDGRRPQGRAQHEGLPRHPRSRPAVCHRRPAAAAGCSASTCGNAISRASASPEPRLDKRIAHERYDHAQGSQSRPPVRQAAAARKKPVVTLKEHIVEIISDSGEGAQRCGQSLGSIAAQDGQRHLDGGDHPGRDPPAGAQRRRRQRQPHPHRRGPHHQRRRRDRPGGRLQRAGAARAACATASSSPAAPSCSRACGAPTRTRRSRRPTSRRTTSWSRPATR